MAKHQITTGQPVRIASHEANEYKEVFRSMTKTEEQQFSDDLRQLTPDPISGYVSVERLTARRIIKHVHKMQAALKFYADHGISSDGGARARLVLHPQQEPDLSDHDAIDKALAEKVIANVDRFRAKQAFPPRPIRMTEAESLARAVLRLMKETEEADEEDGG